VAPRRDSHAINDKAPAMHSAAASSFLLIIGLHDYRGQP
jgi:hypothetical protein